MTVAFCKFSCVLMISLCFFFHSSDRVTTTSFSAPCAYYFRPRASKIKQVAPLCPHIKMRNRERQSRLLVSGVVTYHGNKAKQEQAPCRCSAREPWSQTNKTTMEKEHGETGTQNPAARLITPALQHFSTRGEKL